MQNDDLYQATQSLIGQWLDRLDWAVANGDSTQRQRALALKTQVLELKNKVDLQASQGVPLNDKQVQVLQHVVPALMNNLPPKQ